MRKSTQTSSTKTATQRAKDRLAADPIDSPTSRSAAESINLSSSSTSVGALSHLAEPTIAKMSAKTAAVKSEAATVAQPELKRWRITTFSDLPEVDDWFQDKLIYILSHLLRKARILKRRLIEFTFPEKGIVEIVWQDIATGEMIYEGGAAGGTVAESDEDPLG